MTASSGVAVWSKTAATNNTIDTAVNYAEGQAPSSVNDSARAAMASTAKWRDDNSGSLATTGTSTAYVLTTNQNLAGKDSSFVADYTVAFQLDEDCGTPVTLNVDSLGAKPLRAYPGVELVAASLKSGGIYHATYKSSNSGEWILHDVNPTILADGQVATAKIADGAVTLAKLVDASAQYKILGRKSASAGDWEECSLSEVLDFVTSPTRGDVLVRGASTWGRLSIATAGLVPIGDGADATAGYPKLPLLHVADVRAAGGAGDTTAASVWQACTLQTTLTNEITSASLATNQITLPAGTYEVDGWATVPGVGSNSSATAVRLRNITAGATLVMGPGFVVANVTSGVPPLKGRFTLAVTSVIELQRWYTIAGFSALVGNTGDTNKYADVQIRKVA